MPVTDDVSVPGRFADRRVLVQVLLGFSSGLPLLLTAKTLQAWSTEAGLDLVTLGMLNQLALPYSLKFLLAPLVDAVRLPFGRRRGWLLASQAGVMLAILALAFQQPGTGFAFLACAALVALLSALQDVVADAYRLEVLPPERRGTGISLFVTGYRLGTITAFAGAMALASHLSWPAIYGLLAVTQGIGLLGTLMAPEPDQAGPERSWRGLLVDPLVDWFAGRTLLVALVSLLFVACYKLDDALAQGLVVKFLLDAGYSQGDIGFAQGVLGVGATILGTLFGGWVVDRLGLNRALWVLGLAQASGVLAYAWLASQVQPGVVAMWVVVVIEYLGAGLGTAGLLAFLMGLCNARFSAMQYALLSSFMAFGRTEAASATGWLVQSFHLSWPAFFLWAAAAGIPGLLLLTVVAPWRGGSTPLATRRIG